MLLLLLELRLMLVGTLARWTHLSLRLCGCLLVISMLIRWGYYTILNGELLLLLLKLMPCLLNVLVYVVFCGLQEGKLLLLRLLDHVKLILELP